MLILLPKPRFGVQAVGVLRDFFLCSVHAQVVVQLGRAHHQGRVGVQIARRGKLLGELLDRGQLAAVGELPQSGRQFTSTSSRPIGSSMSRSAVTDRPGQIVRRNCVVDPGGGGPDDLVAVTDRAPGDDDLRTGRRPCRSAPSSSSKMFTTHPPSV